MSALDSRVRAWLPWIVLVVLVGVVAVVAGRPRNSGPALDPRSTSSLGTKALVDTLRELNVAVAVQSQAPAPTDTTAVLFSDDLDDTGRAALTAWVESGGTLVLTDVLSPLNPAPPDLRGVGNILQPEPDQVDGSCPLAALADVRRVVAPSAIYMKPPPGAVSCFRKGDTAWLVETNQGRGRVVVLGGGSALINANIGEGDNAVLAVDLLAPTAAGRVVVLQPRPAGGGDKGLWSLVARRVKLALLQLAVAFVIVALWRARRLGRPVLEPQPVQIEASELVVAVGELMQRSKARQQAAAVLRDDLRRSLAERMGLPLGTPPDVVADAMATRSSGMTADEVLAVLAGAVPVNEDDLVVLAQKVESVRARLQEVVRAQ